MGRRGRRNRSRARRRRNNRNRRNRRWRTHRGIGMGGGGRYYNHRRRARIMIPDNTIHNQYLTRDDCCKFSTLRFDNGLANQRLTMDEVQQQLDRVHHSVNDFQRSTYSAILCLVLTLAFLGMYIWTMTGVGDSNFTLYIIISVLGGLSTCCANQYY